MKIVVIETAIFLVDLSVVTRLILYNHLRVPLEVSVSITMSMVIVQGRVRWGWDDLGLATIVHTMVVVLA